MRLADAIPFDADGERGALEVAVLGAEVIAHNAVDHEGAVHFARCGEDLATGEIAPFVDADDAAGLDPLVALVEVGGDVGAGRGAGMDGLGGGGDLPDLYAQPVHLDGVAP